MDLEKVLPIFLLEASFFGRARQFPWFSHGDETSAEFQGEAGAEEEAASFETDYYIWAVGWGEGLLDVEDESVDELFVKMWRGEQGKNIFKEDAWRGKVGELWQRMMLVNNCS